MSNKNFIVNSTLLSIRKNAEAERKTLSQEDVENYLKCLKERLFQDDYDILNVLISCDETTEYEIFNLSRVVGIEYAGKEDNKYKMTYDRR